MLLRMVLHLPHEWKRLLPRDCRKSALRLVEEVEKHVSTLLASSGDLPRPLKVSAYAIDVLGTPSHPSEPWEWWDQVEVLVDFGPSQMDVKTFVSSLEAWPPNSHPCSAVGDIVAVSWPHKGGKAGRKAAVRGCQGRGLAIFRELCTARKKGVGSLCLLTRKLASAQMGLCQAIAICEWRLRLPRPEPGRRPCADIQEGRRLRGVQRGDSRSQGVVTHAGSSACA